MTIMQPYEPNSHSLSHKMILSGNSGAGKTGATLMLTKAGYTVKIADFDDKAGGLIGAKGVLDVKNAKEKVQIASFRENSDSQSQAYKAFKDFLNDEKNGPFSWDENSVFVVDSLTKLGEAIHDWVKRNNPAVKDGRQIYGLAQEELNKILGRLTSSQLKCHFILISHLEYQDLYGGVEGVPSETQAYPAGIGKAKNKFIPTIFNTMLEVVNKKEKRIIRTQPTRFLVNKIPVLPSQGLKDEYPIEDGLIEIFKLLTDTSES